MSCAEYSPADRQALLEIASSSIQHGLTAGEPLLPELSALAPSLCEPRASFVSLHRKGALRGCIGSITATRPLAEDVAASAYQAAFTDPRFAPVSASEVPELELEISVLSPLQAMPVDSEQELLQKLRPGEDGLLLEDGWRRATFLPVVWEQLPNAHDFLAHLKSKGGWPLDYWAADIKVYRYRTQTFR